MEKNLKIKQQNYHDSKVIVQSNVLKKDSVTNFINRDIGDTVLKLIQDRKNNLSADLFVSSDNLCSYIVFVPKNNLDKFLAGYE